MTIDWSKAPEWAQYHAYHLDGVGIWFGTRPRTGELLWWSPDWITGFKVSGYILPAGQDWRQSLTERPKEETK